MVDPLQVRPGGLRHCPAPASPPQKYSRPGAVPPPGAAPREGRGLKAGRSLFRSISSRGPVCEVKRVASSNRSFLVSPFKESLTRIFPPARPPACSPGPQRGRPAGGSLFLGPRALFLRPFYPEVPGSRASLPSVVPAALPPLAQRGSPWLSVRLSVRLSVAASGRPSGKTCFF